MALLANVIQVLLLVTGLFLMLIILLQRGRGGGLAGAFGGAGGQSAFGTKAGDVFTWITVVTATIWVLLAGIGGCAMRKASTSYSASLELRSQPTGIAPADEATDAPATGVTPPADGLSLPPEPEATSTPDTPELNLLPETTTPESTTPETPASEPEAAKPDAPAAEPKAEVTPASEPAATPEPSEATPPAQPEATEPTEPKPATPAASDE